MIKILCTHVGVALLLSAPCLVHGQCQSGNCGTGDCNSGQCATGHCGVGGGGCLGRFLSSHHGGCNTGDCNTGNCNSGGYRDGTCYTCENIWDGYCESKAKCLHGIRLPHPKDCPLKLHHLGHGCGCCDPCAPGVGLYGRRVSCCHHSLFTRLFHKKSSCCDQAVCDTPGCDAGVAAPSAPVEHQPTTKETRIEVEAPAVDPVPPAPAITHQTSVEKPKSFDWLQRALKLN